MDELQARLQRALPARYEVKHEIGRGGMAVVFLAWDRNFECDVALKVLRPELSATLGPERFQREIRTVALLKHPYILKLHDSGEAGGLLYYVMPWLEGESLRDRLKHGPLPLPDALRVAREVAEALHHAHTHNLIHRDIKPDNILFEGGHALVSDFGVALAVSGAGTRPTATGTAVGTIEYMSPEQAAGQDLDRRTDIYSLGLVLYEMLAGSVPKLDLEGTAKTLQRERPEVTTALVEVLRKALAANRDDRFATADEFAHALGKAGGERPVWYRAAIAAAVVVGLGAIGWRVFGGEASVVDPQRYVIVPFAHTRGAAPALLDGDLCARLLYQGFAQWGDVNVTEPLRVSDAVHRLDPGARDAISLDDGLAIARSLGAGRLVRGELWQFRDTTYVTAAVYDLTRGGRELVTREVRLVPGMSEGVVFYALADSLLFSGTHAPPGSPAGRATTSTRALLAHEEAHKALDQWDLDGAAAGFRRAATYDTNFAHALLELAQVKAWQEQDVETWRDTATRAARLSDRLVPRERFLARALDALGGGRHDDACAQYRAVLARDSLDATAWYGLGECQAKDRVVMRDARSPSGWAFRGSFHSAALAYRRALDLAPSLNLVFRGQVYSHLAALLYTESHRLRSGRPVPPDTGLFAAYPDFRADTLAFIPYRAMGVFTGAEGAPRRAADAMVHTRQLLGDIVTSWVRAFPGSAEAHDAEAQWLETQGRLSNALSAIRAARHVAADSSQIDLAVSEIRVLLKSQEFPAARRLADSLLSATRAPNPSTVGALASIAVLTGRARLAADLLRQAGAESDPWTLEGPRLGAPPPVLEGVASFTAFAAAGMPADSVALGLRKADSLIRAWVPSGRRALVRRALLIPAVTLAFPSVGVSPAHEPNSDNYLVEMQLQLSRGDSAAVREQLAQWRASRRTLVYGEVSVDGIYTEAQLFLALRDSAGARDHLDGWLGSLAVSRRSLVWQPTQAGAFVRAMALRAELADRAGDRRTAQRWAANVLALWSDADPALQPVAARMRRIG